MKKTLSTGAVGIDIIETSRFQKLLTGANAHKLKKFFSNAEIAYCRSFQDPAVHLAGHFAAKEAVVKALGAKKISLTHLEIKHDKFGAPEVWHRSQAGHKKLKVSVSISHIKSVAVAVAVC